MGQTLTIGEHKCDISVLLRSADRRTRNIRVRLEASACNGTDTQTLNTTFDVGFYDFPIIDNTRLPNGWRCAIALTNWVDDFAELTTICFPGEYASLKDRPYYEEVIQKLREQSDAPST